MMQSTQNVERFDAVLWSTLESFELDDLTRGAEGRPARTFADRLAEEQGWTAEFAGRVVREYKRFVYLAATGARPVTPSLIVDECWHLHLTYTRSYWERLCGQVLSRPIHHDPGRGGADEDARFSGQYARTLDVYREVFDESPPLDIWPDGRRKGTTGAVPATPQRENQPRAGRDRRAMAAAIGLPALPVTLAGCAVTSQQSTTLWATRRCLPKPARYSSARYCVGNCQNTGRS